MEFMTFNMRCGKRMILTAVFLCLFTLEARADFSDDFSGPTLNPQWQVKSALGTTSFANGNLRFTLEGRASEWGGGGWAESSILSMPFQGKNWQVEAKVNYHIVWTFGGLS